MDVCKDCPLRLFNIKHHNLQGIGNPYFGICIVIPNVDYDAYKKGNIGYSNQVEIIKSIISSTGELTDVFILPFMKYSLPKYLTLSNFLKPHILPVVIGCSERIPFVC